ncbi:hypothetical protein BGZ58_010479, partial [Dissophora ornata]
VHQGFCQQLERERKLPDSDEEDLRYSSVCIAAKSYPLDPTRLPDLNDRHSRFNNIRASDRSYSALMKF